MGRYLILDREDKIIEQITEAIRVVDNQPQIEKFADIPTLEKHVAELDPEAVADFWSFDLLILDYGLHQPTAWVENIAKLKAQNKKECSVVLTGYENNHTTAKFIRPLDIYNFLFKPFDSLILKESLNLALKLNKKAQPLEMKSQSSGAFIASLKEVELQTISELGFVTFSDVKIETGAVTKYFSPIFAHGKKQSVWAQCLISVPHPQKTGTFINKFQFYGAEQSLLNTVRKYIANRKADQVSSALWNFNPPKQEITVNLALIGLDNDENKALAADLEAKYANLKVEFIKLDSQKKAQAMTAQHHITLNTTDIKHEAYASLFSKECIHLWFTNAVPKDDEIKDHASEYHDIFVKPLDRSYFFKKLKIHINALRENEQSHLINITSHEVMKAASKVKISEISELYVNITYSRELPVREFREFVFLNEDETQNVELPAFCNYKEKLQGSGAKDEPPAYLHQFVFFAMTDHLLKQIRLWLLHNYIASNKKE